MIFMFARHDSPRLRTHNGLHHPPVFFFFLARFLFPAGSSWGALRYHKLLLTNSFYFFFVLGGAALCRIGPACTHISLRRIQVCCFNELLYRPGAYLFIQIYCSRTYYFGDW